MPRRRTISTSVCALPTTTNRALGNRDRSRRTHSPRGKRGNELSRTKIVNVEFEETSGKLSHRIGRFSEFLERIQTRYSPASRFGAMIYVRASHFVALISPRRACHRLHVSLKTLVLSR